MSCKTHRVRYYNPKTESINCVSFNKKTKLIAVARGDASIEIWDLNFAPYVIKCIPATAKSSVEALGWVNDRLLSTGLGGALLEWDLENLNIKSTTILTGYAAWCLDVNISNTLVAVGTEQGYVNVYSVEDNDIVYKKLFDKQEGRIMCCKFDKSGNILVTGSVDTIRVWNVETGHATTRLSVSRRGKETIVWSLAVLTDNVIVSGDSLGRLTFWDCNIGEQIESYTTHKADILSIAVTDNEKKLYCSGVDPVIMSFVKVDKGGDKNSSNWVKHVQRNIHEHDVRALVINGDKLISVGADGYLTQSSYPPKWVMRIPPMIPYPRSFVCAQKKLLLLRYHNNLEVWKLGSYATNKSGCVLLANINVKQNGSNKSGNKDLEQDSAIHVTNGSNVMHSTTQQQTLKLTENSTKLVSVQTKGQKQILACVLSPSGEFIAYSTESDLRMLKLEVDDDQGNISLTKVLISGLTSFCDHIAFTGDSRIMVVHSKNEIKVLQVDPEAGATVVQAISTEKYLKRGSILHVITPKEGNSRISYLIVADTQGAIAVWVRTAKKFEYHVSLPKYRCVPSAMTVNPITDHLIVTYVDQKIVEYDLINKKMSQWPGMLLPEEWLKRKSVVSSVCMHPRRNALVFHDETSLWILDRDAKVCERPAVKRKPQANNLSMDLRIVPIKYLAGFHWIGDDEAVTIEILPESIVSQLPPALAVKRHNLG